MTHHPHVGVRQEIIDVSTSEGPMAVLRKWPEGVAAPPKVVMFHDGPGVRNATHRFAEALASEGFDVVVPDLYHRHGRLIGYEPDEREAEPSLVDHLRYLLATLTDDGIQADLEAMLGAIGTKPTERLGTIGFCVGARAVAQTLIRRPHQFVVGAMWHPSFLADNEPGSPHLTADRIDAPLYIGVGDADQIQPIAVNQPFFDIVASRPNVDIRLFHNVDHAYTWPDWPTYDEHAASVSFNRTVTLLHENI